MYALFHDDVNGTRITKGGWTDLKELIDWGDAIPYVKAEECIVRIQLGEITWFQLVDLETQEVVEERP